jgi:hypothetical protein
MLSLELSARRRTELRREVSAYLPLVIVSDVCRVSSARRRTELRCEVSV